MCRYVFGVGGFVQSLNPHSTPKPYDAPPPHLVRFLRLYRCS